MTDQIDPQTGKTPGYVPGTNGVVPTGASVPGAPAGYVPLNMRPRKAVNIVAMGASRETWVAGMMADQRLPIFQDAETWAVNYMASTFHVHRLIALDPMQANMHLPPVKAMCENTLKMGVPVYTSEPNPQFPNQVMYPYHAVWEKLRSTYFNTTVAYAAALAIVEEFTDIGLFGADFSYPNLHVAESGRACVEHWLAVAAARGARIAIAQNSTLMDMNTTVEMALPGAAPFRTQQSYGWWADPMTPPERGGQHLHPMQCIIKSKAWWDGRMAAQAAQPVVASAAAVPEKRTRKPRARKALTTSLRNGHDKETPHAAHHLHHPGGIG